MKFQYHRLSLFFSVGVGCAVPVKFDFLCLVALRTACIIDCTLERTNATTFPLLLFGSGKKDASPDLALGYKIRRTIQNKIGNCKFIGQTSLRPRIFAAIKWFSTLELELPT